MLRNLIENITKLYYIFVFFPDTNNAICSLLALEKVHRSVREMMDKESKKKVAKLLVDLKEAHDRVLACPTQVHISCDPDVFKMLENCPRDFLDLSANCSLPVDGGLFKVFFFVQLILNSRG